MQTHTKQNKRRKEHERTLRKWLAFIRTQRLIDKQVRETCAEIRALRFVS